MADLPEMITVYVSIGNSDDKLTQNDWSHFYAWTADRIDRHAWKVHGRWFSDPSSPWQNAAWCFEIAPHAAESLKRALAATALVYRQDSIAWAVAETTFIGPARDEPPAPRPIELAS
jgi:hypothetical protein